MAKKYFRKGDDDCCYELPYHYDYMKEKNLKELELIEASREISTGMFWCNELQEIGNTNNGSCGKMCDEYKPRNGKNGLCKHWRHPYSYTDKNKILKLKANK